MILSPGAPLLSIALNADVLATVLLAVSVLLLLMLANDRKLMGTWANRLNTRILAGTVAHLGRRAVLALWALPCSQASRARW